MRNRAEKTGMALVIHTLLSVERGQKTPLGAGRDGVESLTGKHAFGRDFSSERKVSFKPIFGIK